MGADRLELDHRRIAKAEVLRRVEIALRYQDALAHSAVDVDAEHLQRRAQQLGLPFRAGDAVAAGEVGIDDDRRPRGEVGARRTAGDRAGQLVTHDTGIGEEGMRALEDVEVGAADSDGTDVDRHQPRACVGHRYFPSLELARLDHAIVRIPPSSSSFCPRSARLGSLVAALGSDLECARPAGHAKRRQTRTGINEGAPATRSWGTFTREE